MNYIQILDCSDTLGNCCNSYVLANILNITQNIFSLIQLIVPILLIITGTVQFVQLTINPEMKGGFRKVLNKLIAAFIIFFLPVLVDAVVNLAPNSISVASCWEEASNIVLDNSDYRYIEGLDDDKSSKRSAIVVDPKKFDRGKPSSNSGSNSSNNPNAKVAAYAKQFVGKPYRLGGFWNGSERYTATDCCGFVVGAYRHFGVNFSAPCKNLWNNTAIAERVSENNIRAGDIVYYDKKGKYYHFAILTGNGEEIVHASNERDGVKLSSTYKYRKIVGFIRIKGVK